MEGILATRHALCLYFMYFAEILVTEKLNRNTLRHDTLLHRRRKGLNVGGAEVCVVAAEVDPRCGGLGAQPPDADEGIIPCNSKVAPK